MTDKIVPIAEDYYLEAESWHEAIFASKEKQIALYRHVSLGLALAFTMAMVCLAVLITRESVQPFLAVVDKRTGEVTTPTRLNTQTASLNWNMVRHFVKNYVNARESYSSHDLDGPYQTALLMSSTEVKTQIDGLLRPELNKESPVRKYASQHHIRISIHSVTKLSNDHLLDVRFTSHLINSETNKEEGSEEWRATMKWELANLKQSLSEWDKNPLGFRVIFYDKQPVQS